MSDKNEDKLVTIEGIVQADATSPMVPELFGPERGIVVELPDESGEHRQADCSPFMNRRLASPGVPEQRTVLLPKVDDDEIKKSDAALGQIGDEALAVIPAPKMDLIGAKNPDRVVEGWPIRDIKPGKYYAGTIDACGTNGVLVLYTIGSDDEVDGRDSFEVKVRLSDDRWHLYCSIVEVRERLEHRHAEGPSTGQ